MEKSKKQIMIALSGTSPAVLTEAVWGLATAQPPVVPDEIIVLTTGRGRALIRERLMKGGIWKKLAATLAKRGIDVAGKLVFNEEMPVFTHGGKAVEDLLTREQNLEAANTMMRVIQWYAKDKDCVVHALMSGGRKTMSALFFSSMCLLGRKTDHIYHVLVSEGYEDPGLVPPFYFPQAGVVHKGKKACAPGKKGGRATAVALKSEACEINLFDVPFVPMGEWAEQKCKAISKRLNYENIIHAVSDSMDAALYPEITVDFMGGACVTADGTKIEGISDTDFVVLVMLLQGFGRDSAINRIAGLKGGLDELEGGEARAIKKHPCSWIRTFEWRMSDAGEESVKPVFFGNINTDGKRLRSDFSRAKDHLKKAFAKAGCGILCHILDGKGDGAAPSGFHPEATIWKNAHLLPEAVRENLLPEDAPFPVG